MYRLGLYEKKKWAGKNVRCQSLETLRTPMHIYISSRVTSSYTFARVGQIVATGAGWRDSARSFSVSDYDDDRIR